MRRVKAWRHATTTSYPLFPEIGQRRITPSTRIKRSGKWSLKNSHVKLVACLPPTYPAMLCLAGLPNNRCCPRLHVRRRSFFWPLKLWNHTSLHNPWGLWQDFITWKGEASSLEPSLSGLLVVFFQSQKTVPFQRLFTSRSAILNFLQCSHTSCVKSV